MSEDSMLYILDLSVPVLTEHLGGLSLTQLSELLEAEKHGKTRKGALAAIKAAINSVSAPSVEVPSALPPASTEEGSEPVVIKRKQVVTPEPVVETELIGAVRPGPKGGDLAARLMEAGIKPPPGFQSTISAKPADKGTPINIPSPGTMVVKPLPFQHEHPHKPSFSTDSVVREVNPSRLPAPQYTPNANPVAAPVYIATPEPAKPIGSALAKLRVAQNALQQAQSMTPDPNLRNEIIKALKHLEATFQTYNGAEQGA